MKYYSFPRKMRLSTYSHFDYVFQQPKRSSTQNIIILGRLNSLDHPRVGLAVSKKNVRYAHERNRIKRLVRESFRLNQHTFPAIDFVIIVKKGITELNNSAFLAALRKLWFHQCLLAHIS